ncbi:MAG: TetR/AcrR family transcriptional regulator, partial [Atribacterota bacterium]|nr:TetR/AcrR family transcriptional regulator [Atribacterota bacterium]
KNKVKKRILITARKYFFTQGYSKATMDELATELHMSKKTLYHFFRSKQLLLESVIYDFFQELHEKINKIIKNKKNRKISLLKQFMSSLQEQISQFNSWAFEDIQKNNPEAWQMINNLEEKLINNELRKLLQEGKNEGAIRQDIDLDLMVLMILNTIKSIVIPEVVSQLSYSTEEVIDMLAKIFINGISKPEKLV